jgi:hypothetical protein
MGRIFPSRTTLAREDECGVEITGKRAWTTVVAGLALTGLLAGCGSQSTASGQSASASASSNATDQNQSGDKSNQHHNGQGMVQMLEKAGVSQSDAQNLAKLIQQTSTDPKWVMDQLKNKVSVSEITTEINDGKAPKRQWNGNHPHANDQNQAGNSNAQSSSASNTNGSGAASSGTSGNSSQN